MANTRIKGTLVISKVDADTEKLLPDAGFRIYGADGETVIKEGYTDKNGVAEFELEFGKYFYQEFDAPEGYQIDDTMYEFSVFEDGQLVSVVMANQLEEKPDKQEENTPKPETTKPSTSSDSADGPKTGDDANVRLLTGIAVSALAAAVAGIYIICRGKKRDEEDD